MKNILRSFAAVALVLAATVSVTSCEDYLDKDPDSDVSMDVVFKNFRNVQGYIEEIYNCIPNIAQCGWAPVFNIGDDEINNPQADVHINHQVDIGNFWAWETNDMFWFSNANSVSNSNDAHAHHFYGHAWYCIAKCNKALAEIDNYFVGTEEEKNLLLGQIYFFRGWWHFGMMQFFGGIPYIDHVLDPAVNPTNIRLSYQECAEKAAYDFQKAADLLPVDWNSTSVGKNTGDNSLRITKVTALAYLGKNYLWAASPLMQHGAQKGGKRTYDYSTELAAKAAMAFGEILNYVEEGCQYKLNEFSYKNVADHEKASGVEYSYSENWFTTGRSGIQPGGTEAIMRGPSKGWSYSRYNISRNFCPNDLADGADNILHLPTANYVKNYGMANGLPIDDPESGFDIQRPFKDRDPRFYHDIVYDGMEYIKAEPKSNEHKKMKYAGLATGGSMRAVANASRTGYLCNKFVCHLANVYDGKNYDDSGAIPHFYIPFMRLADIYLMYAEATAVLGGPNGKSSNCTLTSVDAINVLRDRCGAGHVAAKFTGNDYMDEVRRERAVELAFEGLRFNDLQRWLLLTEPEYIVKTSQEFVRVDGADESFFAENDPREARVAEFREEVILERNFDTKHYWFPVLRNDTYIVDGFEQNPGW